MKLWNYKVLILLLIFNTTSLLARQPEDSGATAPLVVPASVEEIEDSKKAQSGLGEEDDTEENTSSEVAPTEGSAGDAKDGTTTEKSFFDTFKFGTKNWFKGTLLWGMYGPTVPLSGLKSPSSHIELAFDMPLLKRFKWGPYYSRSTATANERISFESTGYYENRKNLITSQVFGVQGRAQVYEKIHGRVGAGISFTDLVVQSASTNAPLGSNSVGYKESYPMSFAAFAALQYNWAWTEWGLALESGLNVTALTQPESISEIYFGIVGRYFLGRSKKGQKLAPKKDGTGRTLELPTLPSIPSLPSILPPPPPPEMEPVEPADSTQPNTKN
jgi:hypothetical protein